MGQSGVCFIDTDLMLLVISGFKKHLPCVPGMFGFHGSFVSPVFRSQLACVQRCMLHVHVQHLPAATHQQPHTNTHVQWAKYSPELFSNKDTACYC